MRKEFEEQQKKSVIGNAAGGGNPLQSFDMAGWMAGQTSSKGGSNGGSEGREKEKGRGDEGGGSKVRRRG